MSKKDRDRANSPVTMDGIQEYLSEMADRIGTIVCAAQELAQMRLELQCRIATTQLQEGKKERKE